MIRKRLAFLLLTPLLVLLLVACDGDFQANPLGYSFVGQTLVNNQHRTVPVAPSHGKSITHLRPYGIGLLPDAFTAQYGQPLAPSQPPTQLWFKATLDDFPAGSVMIVGFDRSTADSQARANEISYVAGNTHPTTDTQAETIAVSFLPDDAQGPTILHPYSEHANTCLSEVYTSATLATLFPAQDFTDASGKLAKTGTITLSLFPHYGRSTTQEGYPEDNHPFGGGPDQPNAVSSFLLTLGTKSYC